MPSPNIRSKVSITHIGTATALLEIDAVTLLTDPFFSPAGTEWDLGVAVLKNTDTPAMALADLPPIDAILLSHEDHPDNLDEPGRQLLDGRHVLTTMDGAAKLAPQPGVRGLRPWETVTLAVAGSSFEVTATPCKHLPGGECTGFVLTTERFGTSAEGLPNAIYISGDTVYMEELTQIAQSFHILVAILNLGAAMGPSPDGPLLITMDGKQGARLFRELKAEILIPMHFESWAHFTQGGSELKEVFAAEGIQDKVQWLEPGKKTKIV